MNKIRIVNWLLTRRCNLNCDYCAIVKDYDLKPPQYPDMRYYAKNEMTTSYVQNVLKLIKEHNPEAFHIFYGGEPLLRKDLPDIINFCNHYNIHYTIISNNTPQIQPLIKRLFEETDYIQGFTSSVDPVLDSTNTSKDRIVKSIEGFKQLVEIKKQGKIKDVVAEITVMKHNVEYLYDLVKKLSENGINSDITFIDISKNPYYDFANVYDVNQLVTKEEAREPIEKLLKSDFDIHMKDQLLPMIYASLPSNMDCKIDRTLHNISIDADGSVRLCLRIRGVVTPSRIRAHELFFNNEVSTFATLSIKEDKRRYCQLCNHTCHLMSQIINSGESEFKDLIHKNKREDK